MPDKFASIHDCVILFAAISANRNTLLNISQNDVVKFFPFDVCKSNDLA